MVGDKQTYKCRVGMFAGMFPHFLGYSHVIKLVGAVTFIEILLILAGVEQNPGPKDIFISRYQYLLIDIGTRVLRMLFEGMVGNNFMKFLTANPNYYNHIQFLIQKGIITDAQKDFLPPIDTNPSSSNFDITLLACLLRNVCGLRCHKDPVWKNPSSTDLSVEADITRLRDCRNYLSHIKTVLISDTEMTTKWDELSAVLKRLNGTGGVKNLSVLIDDAQHMSIDDVLKARYDDAVKSWAKMDQSFDDGIEDLKLDLVELKDGQSQLKDCHSELRTRQTELIDGQSELKHGLSELQNGQSKLVNGQSCLQVGQSELKQGQTQLKYGQTEIKDAQTEIKVHQYELRFSLSEMKHGQREMKNGLDEVKRRQKDETKRYQTTCDDLHETNSRIKHIESLLLEKTCVKLEEVTAVKDNLSKIYEKDCSTLNITPFCCDDEEGLDLIKIYQPPSMFHVPYLREETERKESLISSYLTMFVSGDQEFKNIYLTGDVGVGKTSFCKRMSLLWCKSQRGEHVDNNIIQKDIDFMKIFEFVFYVSLGDTDLDYVVDIIIEQLVGSKYKHEEMVKVIEHVLQHYKCLIIMDALDEWIPKACSTKSSCNVPKLFSSAKCTHITTCRPYRMEDVRVSHKNIDRQLHITGIHGSSSLGFVREMVKHVNTINRENKKPDTFMREVEQCGLADQISIPIIASHLIMVWFDKELADWSVAQLYSHIVEMLFERFERSNSGFQPPIVSELSLPDSLSDFVYVRKYFTSLEKLSLLSFRSLFKHDKCMSGLVFTKEQLMKEPYSIPPETIKFLCRIGILSKNKIIGRFGKKEHTLSFIHRSFVEYFAALFVTSFDAENAFAQIVNKWNTVKDVLQFQNFFLLLAGLSYEKIKDLFENIYSIISDDLTVLRRNVVSYYDSDSLRNPYREQIASLQDTVINCFKAVRGDKYSNIELQLQDFVFDDNADNPILTHLLHINRACIKSIHALNGKYLDMFDQIKELQGISIGKVLPVDYVKFVKCMLQNNLSLKFVFIKGDNTEPLIPKLPVRCHRVTSMLSSFVKIQNNNSRRHLTSISLSNVTIPGNKFTDLLKFLSGNVFMENITLYKVTCTHADRCVLDLSKHTRLASLCLVNVGIVCDKVNGTSLRNMRLCPLSESIGRGYDVILNSLRDSHLEHLYISGNNMLDCGTIKALTFAVKTLKNIKSIRLGKIALPDDVILQLDCNTSEVAIRFYRVTMSLTYLQKLADNLVSNTNLIKVKLYKCRIKSIKGGTFCELSDEGSMNYASKRILSTRVSITYTGSGWLHFETLVK